MSDFQPSWTMSPRTSVTGGYEKWDKLFIHMTIKLHYIQMKVFHSAHAQLMSFSFIPSLSLISLSVYFAPQCTDHRPEDDQLT